MSAAIGHRAARWAPVEVTDLDPRPRQHRPGGQVQRHATAIEQGRFANPLDVPRCSPVERMGALVEFATRLAGRADDLAAVRSELGGRDLSCTCALDDPGCHRGVLLDVANPPGRPMVGGGHAMAITVRRPWASMLLIPAECGGKTVENLTWATDYRGPVMIYGGSMVNEYGVQRATQLGWDAQWHTRQRGWLGATVLTDVHKATPWCCKPWGQRAPRDAKPKYHWVFAHPARLAAPTWAQGERDERRGFEGIRAMSWSVLTRAPKAAHDSPAPAGGDGAQECR